MIRVAMDDPSAVADRHVDGAEAAAPQTLLLTVAEVERELRLGRTRVYQLLRAGEIPSIRLGNRAIRVTREDLRRWIESRYQASIGVSSPTA